MKENFLKIPNERLLADKTLSRDIYLFLVKNNKMIKIREAGFFFDENAIERFKTKGLEFFIFAQDRSSINPNIVSLYVEQSGALESKEPEQIYQSEDSKVEPIQMLDSDGQVIEPIQKFSPDGQVIEPIQKFSPDGQVIEPIQKFNPDGSVAEPIQKFNPDGQVIEPIQKFNPDGSVAEPIQKFNPDGSVAEPIQKFNPDGQVIEPIQKFNPDGSVAEPIQKFNPDGSVAEPIQRFNPDGSVAEPIQRFNPDGSVAEPIQNFNLDDPVEMAERRFSKRQDETSTILKFENDDKAESQKKKYSNSYNETQSKERFSQDSLKTEPETHFSASQNEPETTQKFGANSTGNEQQTRLSRSSNSIIPNQMPSLATSSVEQDSEFTGRISNSADATDEKVEASDLQKARLAALPIQDDEMFSFTPEEKEDVPVHSVNKLQNMIEKAKENIIRTGVGNSPAKKAALQNEWKQELSLIIRSNFIAAKGAAIAAQILQMQESENENEESQYDQLNRILTELKKPPNHQAKYLSSKEITIVDEQIATHVDAIEDKKLSEEEQLIKISIIVEDLKESQNSARALIMRALEQNSLKNSLKNAFENSKKDGHNVAKDVRTSIANYVTYLALTLGYNHKPFLIEIALAALSEESFEYDRDKIDIKKLSPFIQKLLSGESLDVPDSAIEDIRQVLDLAHQYTHHEKFDPSEIRMEPTIFTDLYAKFSKDPNYNQVNLERWHQAVVQGANLNAIGLCSQISTVAQKNFRALIQES